MAEKGLSSAPDILDSVEVHESIGPEAESSSDVDATLLEALSQELDKQMINRQQKQERI